MRGTMIGAQAATPRPGEAHAARDSRQNGIPLGAVPVGRTLEGSCTNPSHRCYNPPDVPTSGHPEITMTLAAGTRLGPYEVQSLLGAGGMGEVYKAHDTQLKRDVALKILPSQLALDSGRLARFDREAQALAALNHPHIAQVYGFLHEGDVRAIVMELVEGPTLAESIARSPVPVDEALPLAIQLADALEYAHERGIIHRDFKPANIKITPAGDVKVLDFGLAKVVADEIVGPATDLLGNSPTMTSPAMSRVGVILGTAAYMAPEQARGATVDKRADIWAFGVVLFEMLTGKPCFRGETVTDVLASVVKSEPDWSLLPSDTPSRLRTLLQRCLAKDRKRRLQAIGDGRIEMQEVAETGETVGPGPRPGIGSRILAALVAAVVLTAVALGFFVIGRRSAPSPQPAKFTRLTFQRGFVTNARFTPDLKRVIYSATWEGHPFELFETNTDGTGTRPLDQRGALHAIASDGRLALKPQMQLSLAGLFAPGPLAVMQSSGDAPRDREDNVVSADWSRDGSTMAIVTRIAGEARLEMPPGKILARTAGWFADVRVSPNGRRIAFAEHPVLNNARGTVALVELGGQNKITLTSDLSITGIAWSPDGNEVWFSGVTKAGPRPSLNAVRLDGAMRVVADLPSSTVLKDIAPDGRVLLVSERLQSGIRGKSSAGDREKELGWLDLPAAAALSTDGSTLLFEDWATYNAYVRPMDGSRPTRLGEGIAWSLSPDGRWALAVRNGKPTRLVLIPTKAGREVPLPSGQVETYDDARFLSNQQVVFIGAEHGRPQRTWVQDVLGGQPRAVTPEGATGVTTSADGRFVAVTQDSRLVIFPFNGGEPKPMGAIDAGELVCQWSDDGRTLYSYLAGTTLQVFARDVRLGAKRLFKSLELPDPSGAAFYNLVMTRDSRSYAYSYYRVLDELYLVEGLK